MTEQLKKTPLHSQHLEHGAKMTPFAGYDMPVSYTGIKEEHLAVRGRAGLFDVSHMGEAEFRGSDACRAVDYLMTNDISKLKVGGAMYTTMCNKDGGIVDDLIVYHVADEHYLVCLNASNREKDMAHMREHLITGDVVLQDTSEQWAQLALQGPKSEEILAKVAELDLGEVKRFQVKGGVIRTETGLALCLIARTGYTGEDGFEIYIPKKFAEGVFRAILEVGESEGLVLAGLGCRDTLRLESKYMLYGNDIDESCNPFEAGLGWVVKLNTEHDFVGKEALKNLKEAGLERELVGFVLEGRGVLRSGLKIFSNGEIVGELTSGSYSPSLGQSIGLGYIKKGVNEGLEVEIRNKKLPVRLEKKSFL